MSINLFEEYKDLDKTALNIFLFLACQEGSLEKVKYLLTSPELKEHADITYGENTPNYILTTACYYKNIDIIEYLLTSPDLKVKANIHDNYDNPLKVACREGNLDVVKYLLTSPNLQEHADIYIEDGSIFNLTCLREKIEILDYLIFDYKIEKTQTISNFMEHKLPIMTIVKNMFQKRELEQELNHNSSQSKKVKL